MPAPASTIARTVAIAALAVLAAAPALHAQGTGGSGERLNLQLMEQKLRGLSYHQEQQRLRELDRRAAGAPLGRLEVPVMRPGCPAGAGGSRLSTGC